MNVNTLAMEHSAVRGHVVTVLFFHPWSQGSGSRLRGLETGVLNYRAILLALEIGPLTLHFWVLNVSDVGVALDFYHNILHSPDELMSPTKLT